MNDTQLPVKTEETGALTIPVENLGQIVTELMGPVMKTIGKLLENNTAALEQLAAAQSIQNDRLAALEKQIRLQTPISSKQAQYINDAIRCRARELLDKRGVDDRKACVKLGNSIRKSVLSRYGVANLREIPQHEYPIALQQIGMWNEALTVRDVVKEARSLSTAAPGPEGPVGENVYSGNSGNGAAIPPEQAKRAEPAQAEGHVRKKYGKYGNVLLTDEEIAALEKEFTDLGARIDWLSEYIASGKGGSKPHAAMLRSMEAKTSDDDKQKEIKSLEIRCRLHETGAITDTESYKAWKERLRELKGS